MCSLASDTCSLLPLLTILLGGRGYFIHTAFGWGKSTCNLCFGETLHSSILAFWTSLCVPYETLTLLETSLHSYFLGTSL